MSRRGQSEFTRTRRTWGRLLGVGARLVTVALVAASCAAEDLPEEPVETVETLTFDSAVEAVSFEVSSGGIDIQVGDTEAIRIQRRWWRGVDNPGPRLTAEVEDGTLRIEVDCDQVSGPCGADHQVILPAAVRVSGAIGSGGVRVAGARGPVTVRTGSGGIALSDVSGDVIAESRSGAIELIGIRGAIRADTRSGAVALLDVHGEIDAHSGSGALYGDGLDSDQALFDTGSGGVFLGFAGTPRDVEVRTGSGGVMLVVPSGSYATSLHTGAGVIQVNGIVQDARSEASIVVQTGSGEVRVAGY